MEIDFRIQSGVHHIIPMCIGAHRVISLRNTSRHVIPMRAETHYVLPLRSEARRVVPMSADITILRALMDIDDTLILTAANGVQTSLVVRIPIAIGTIDDIRIGDLDPYVLPDER